MEIKIEKKQFKPLIDRDEIILRISDSKITPTNAQVQAETAKMINTSADIIVVKKISQKFGMHESEALVYAYKSQEALKKFEPKPKKSKKEKSKEGEEKAE